MEDQVASARSEFRSAYRAYIDAGAALHNALCSDLRNEIPALQNQLLAAAAPYETARRSYVNAVMSEFDVAEP